MSEPLIPGQGVHVFISERKLFISSYLDVHWWVWCVVFNWWLEILHKIELKTQTPTEKHKLQSVTGEFLRLPSFKGEKSTVCYRIISLKSVIDFTFQKLPSSLPVCNSSRNAFDVPPKGTFITCSFSENLSEYKVKYPISW